MYSPGTDCSKLLASITNLPPVCRQKLVHKVHENHEGVCGLLSNTAQADSFLDCGMDGGESCAIMVVWVLSGVADEGGRIAYEAFS
jgi:hypothetical protein